MKPEPQQLAPIVREVVERFEPIARARGVSTETELEAGVIAAVDAGACCQILLNFLDNAVKYGPTGQTIRVGLDTRYEWARFRVDDEGPGVPQPQRQRIWEAFGRLERDLESAVAGTGIGLAVVLDLVRRQDGRAWVTDAPGGGARFVVQLPLVEKITDDDLEDSAGATEAPTAPALSPRHSDRNDTDEEPARESA